MSSSAVIEGNDDLLIEILLFLPAKSLLTFKTVNKRWRSLISASLFCRRHTLHHPLRRRETQTLILGGNGWKYLVCNPTVPKLYPLSRLRLGIFNVEVVQSCNGLLLGKGGCCYYVFNPTTMQKRELPPLPCKTFAGLYLMFDPCLSPHYDVVCFTHPTREGTTLIYLYKSAEAHSHEWKLVGEGIKIGVSCRVGFYFNGGICFPSFRSSSSCLFSPDDRKLTKIPDIPQHQTPYGRQRSCVVESNGVVFCLTLSWNKERSNLLIVYEMKEKEMGWRKKHELDMNPVMAKCGGIRVVGMVRAEKEEEDYVLMFCLSGKMKIYRFCDGDVEDIDDWCWGNVHHFIETLAPV